MPYLIDHIDAIARQKQRAVLFVEFHPQDTEDDSPLSYLNYDYEHDARRQAFMDWLDERSIGWCPCAPIADECGFESYLGQVYIDLRMDESDPTYCELRDHLEHPDGSIREDNVRFYVLKLEVAMQNAHHDEPGFWERWSETF